MAKALEALKAKKAAAKDAAKEKPAKRKHKANGKIPRRGAVGAEARRLMDHRGRRPMFPGEEMVTLAFRIPASLVARIDKVTDNRAGLIRDAISERLDGLRAAKKAAKAARA